MPIFPEGGCPPIRSLYILVGTDDQLPTSQNFAKSRTRKVDDSEREHSPHLYIPRMNSRWLRGIALKRNCVVPLLQNCFKYYLCFSSIQTSTFKGDKFRLPLLTLLETENCSLPARNPTHEKKHKKRTFTGQARLNLV